ncbi:helix-turn-helix domain-containing protein [Alistipes sp.]|uniref:helix-turn-helix transcriptional regulator n=1 Tax=Alistipes sp. TaxID=1872444 RepID=UPI00307EB7BB
MDAHNNISNFPDDFPIAGLTVKQFIELCVSLGFGNRPNSYPNKPKSPPPEIMGIDDVIKLTGYSKASLYKFTHQRLIPFHRPAHGGRRLVFIRQEIEDWMKENSIPTVGQYCKEQLKKLNN